MGAARIGKCRNTISMHSVDIYHRRPVQVRQMVQVIKGLAKKAGTIQDDRLGAGKGRG
jgi:hypothetical protein